MQTRENVKKSKKPVAVALLVCGGLLSAALAISLPWSALSVHPESIIVIGSSVLLRLPFYLGLIVLVLGIVLFVFAYRIAVPKTKRKADPLAKCLFFVLLLVTVGGILFAVWIFGVRDVALHIKLSSDDPTKVRLVEIYDEGFWPGDDRSYIYELPPHSIVAHKTKTIDGYDSE